jgi:hypothetical protein
VRLDVTLTDGRTFAGEVLGRGLNDWQLRSADGRIHLLRTVGPQFREVTSQTDWPNRTAIQRATASRR